jgi:HSP20 family protein
MAETAAKQAKSVEAVPVRHVAPRPALPMLWESEIERLFDDLFEEDRGFFRLPRLFRRRLPALAEAPRLTNIDVFETDDAVVIKAEMPGVAKADVDISLTNSTITIKGEKKRAEEIKEDDYYRSERSFGMVSRTLDLPCEVKADQTTAKMSDGVLEIRAPKSEEAKKHKAVKVKVG